MMGVSYEQEGAVRIIVIDRPERANAIDLDTARRLSEIFDDAERDDATRTVVLTGAGDRAFSAGMDLGLGRSSPAAVAPARRDGARVAACRRANRRRTRS
jgi:enoyl-CoA hydratase/carnithine racemase